MHKQLRMIQLKNNRNWFLSAKINALTPYRERVKRKRERERERYSYRKDVAFGSKRHEQSYRLPVSNSLHFLSFGRHGTPMVVSGRHHTSDTVSRTHGLTPVTRNELWPINPIGPVRFGRLRLGCQSDRSADKMGNDVTIGTGSNRQEKLIQDNTYSRFTMSL